MAALEALAIGVPVVARSVGGLSELLHGVAGCQLVGSDEPARLAAAVRSVVDDRGVADVRLPARYSIENCASAYAGIYRELAGRAARTGTDDR